ncbi:MAG: hypothetical protein AAF648_08380 [Pseudomonadota bacterium]
MNHRTLARRRRLRRERTDVSGLTGDEFIFGKRVRDGDRINILVEGDSWFAYPRPNIVAGPASNIVSNLLEPLRPTRLINALCLASNGHTLNQIVDRGQLARLTRIFKRYGEQMDLMLLSAGGNDVIGGKELKGLLRDYEPGFTARDCIDASAWEARLARLRRDLETILKLQIRFAPQMPILTHTYDVAEPTSRKGRLLFGLVRTGPWMWPVMNDKNIPEGALRRQIVQELLNDFRNQLLQIWAQYPDSLLVVDTIGTLSPNDLDDWADEIHPTPQGFKRVAAPMYDEMQTLLPILPDRDDSGRYRLRVI